MYVYSFFRWGGGVVPRTLFFFNPTEFSCLIKSGFKALKPVQHIKRANISLDLTRAINGIHSWFSVVLQELHVFWVSNV